MANCNTHLCFNSPPSFLDKLMFCTAYWVPASCFFYRHISPIALTRGSEEELPTNTPLLFTAGTLPQGSNSGQTPSTLSLAYGRRQYGNKLHLCG